MLYIICPSCGEVLGNKQLIFESRMKKVYEELDIDHDMVSRGYIDCEPELQKKRSDIVNQLCRRYCCKTYMLTYIDVVQYIKD